MKNSRLNIFMATILLSVLFAFTTVKNGGIQGKISPVEGARFANAILGRDTLSTQINNGSFTFPNVKAGTYTILVKGIPPYKDTLVENVAVIEDATTDIGVVSLPQ